jgi:CO dehydrogenase maturation factor
MTTTIAVAGKGGVGKTTLAAMVVKHLAGTQGPVLAIDADPSSNLNMLLGLDLESTVGDIRESLLAQVRGRIPESGSPGGGAPAGMAKGEYLDYEIRSSLSEGMDFDLIAMGRPEGPGCYCAVNHTLRQVIDALSSNYRYVVVDNEAGLEHLSRRTTRDVQRLLIVSDPTRQGIVAAGRIAALRHELDIRIEQAHLVVNRLRGKMPSVLIQLIAQLDFPLLGSIPDVPEIADYELTGRPLVDLDVDSALYTAVAGMLGRIL